MPKGQKLIDWTPENDAKLFLTILAVENVHPNSENVARAFGGSVNAMAISNRLSRLRKKAAEEGLVPQGGVAGPAKSSKSSGVGKEGKKAKKGVMAAERSGNENSTSDHGGSHSSLTGKSPSKKQRVLTGRVTKPGSLTKKNAKSNGKNSEDVKGEVEDNGIDAAEGSEGENDIHYGEDVVAAHIKSEEID
ncbi:MAG: hypothetical protein Q9161_006314 [Pseudevernia consocians]